MSYWLFRLNLLSITVLSLGLRILVPPNPGYGAVHDDELMVKMAKNILDTGWVGDYNQMGHLVLSKPPGLSIFLAWTSFLPWAPTVTVHILLLTGLLLFALELQRFHLPRRAVVFIYFFGAFIPAWFNESMSRIYREGLLTALAALSLAVSLWWWRRVIEVSRLPTGVWVSLRQLATPSVVGGLVIGLYVVTKPSWHFLFVVFIAAGGCHVLIGWREISRSVLAKSAALALALLLLAVSAPLGFVITQNKQHFDILALDSFSQGGFARAMKVLYSVEDKLNRPYIDVTKEMRQEAYRVSPTMAKLREYLELPDGQGWRHQPCSSQLGVCDESGAWFPWEFRDAVERAGLAKSAKEFESTFHAIADELDLGCARGIIRCESKGIAPGLDSIDSLSPRIVIDAFGLGFQTMLKPSTGYQERGSVLNAAPESINLWESTVKGLPPREHPTNYRSGSAYLSDIRNLLGTIYNAVWIPILVISTVGITVGRARSSREAQGLRALGVGIALAAMLSIFQIALLEASSGYYMLAGANLYLLPNFPLLVAVVGVGCARLNLLLRPKGSGHDHDE